VAGSFDILRTACASRAYLGKVVQCPGRTLEIQRFPHTKQAKVTMQLSTANCVTGGHGGEAGVPPHRITLANEFN
jgi:hypothetical protein